MAALDIDRDAAHEAAQRELAKPIYPKASLTERLAEWLDELLYRLIQNGSAFPGGWLTITALAILVGIAVIVAVRVARRTMRTNRSGGQGLFGEQVLSAAEHRVTAQRYAAQGDWASAIRHRLRAIARQLEEDGTLNPVPGRTANELAHDAGVAMPGFSDNLASAATIFNDVTYGGQPGSQADYRLIADIDERLLDHSGPLAGAGAHRSADTWAPLR